MSPSVAKFKYQWFSKGDISAAAAIIFDNLTILTFISLILQFRYNFPTAIILKHIIPGTVVGVLVGNLLCIWLSFRLAKRDKRHVIAIPFGLDAPSGIGFTVLIIGPAFIWFKAHGISVEQAGINAWHVGVGCLFVTGLIKLGLSFFANKVKSVIPRAALLGAIGGVAIALIGFIPLLAIFQVPIVGFMALGVVLLTMFAHVRLPFNFPGIPAAIIVGTGVYYVLIPFGLSGGIPDLSSNLTFLLPLPNFSFFIVMHYMSTYIAIVIPFAILVFFGTLSVTESATSLGENYQVRDLVIIDAVATIISSLFGGISQTTPYAGIPAYKKMEARSGFLLINVIVVGVGGILGLVGFIVNLVPESAVAPVLFFVAFEIAMQGFVQSDKKYYPALLFAFFPSIARLLEIKFTDGSLITTAKFQVMAFANAVPHISDNLAIVILGNGFIVTDTLWAALMCFAIDRKWWASFICAIILSVLSYFGIIHSVYFSGKMYLPGNLPESIRNIPLELSLGYLGLGILVIFCSLSQHNNTLILDKDR